MKQWYHSSPYKLFNGAIPICLPVIDFCILICLSCLLYANLHYNESFSVVIVIKISEKLSNDPVQSLLHGADDVGVINDGKPEKYDG